jgi:hypothetical protein
MEEQLGFWRFSLLRTYILEWHKEIVEDFDGKIDSVEMGYSEEINLGISARSLLFFIVNRVTWILNKTYIGIYKWQAYSFGLVLVREGCEEVKERCFTLQT